MNPDLPAELPPSLDYSINDGSSIDITSEARDITWPGDDEDLYSEGFSESPLEKLRSILKSTQGNISQCKEEVNQIASFDEDLKEKCETRAVINLLPLNSSLADAGNFQVISTGVEILVKYGINLLKPKKNPNWRSIKLSNGVFKCKVQPLKGHEGVLRELGYTERNEASFDFLPSRQVPDLDKVAVVTADLLILQRELQQFRDQAHVNRQRFLKYFSLYQMRDLPGGLSTTAIELERISNQQKDTPKPAEVNKESLQIKTPVPAPRRNIPQAAALDTKETKLPSQLHPSINNTKTDSSLSTKALVGDDDIETVPSVPAIKFPPSRTGGLGGHTALDEPFTKPNPFHAWQESPANMPLQEELAGGLKTTAHVPPRGSQSKPTNQGTNSSSLRTPADFSQSPNEGNSRSEKEEPEVNLFNPPVVGQRNKPNAGFSVPQQHPQLKFGKPQPKVSASMAGSAVGYGSPNAAAPPLPPRLGGTTTSEAGTDLLSQEPVRALLGKSVGPPSDDYKPPSYPPQRQLPPGAQPTPFATALQPKTAVPGRDPRLQISGHVNSTTHVKQEAPSFVKQQGNKVTSAPNGSQPAKRVASPPQVKLDPCAMCEGKPGIIHCDKCQSARCEACDRRWHSHPKRKTHQTRRLVPEEPVVEEEVTEEVEEKKDEVCFICGDKATFNCVTCPNYFCAVCEERFHHHVERQSHERFKIGVVKNNQQDAPVQDPLVTGAKPKTSSPAKAKPEISKQPVLPQLSQEEILQNQHEQIVKKDVEVLEQIEIVSQRCRETRDPVLEQQLMQEEKLLRNHHLHLMDELAEIDKELAKIREEQVGEIQARGVGRRADNVFQPPPPLTSASTREERPHTSQEGQFRDNRRQNAPPRPRRTLAIMRKWVCGHCTFQNENLDDKVCGVCSKTTPDPKIVEEREEFEEIERKDEADIHQRDTPYERENYHQHQQEMEESFQEPPEKYQKEDNSQEQKHQENLSYRLLFFYNEAKEGGYTLEDVKTAWDIMEREGGELTMTPVEWLNQHLHAQLEMIAGDIANEFGRTYKLEARGEFPDIVSVEEIHEAWWRNDGHRENTAAEFMERLHEKVEELHAAFPGLEKMHVAHALMERGFNLHQARWYLEEQSVQEDARRVQLWMEKTWETTTSIPEAILEIEESQIEEQEKKMKVRRMLMAEEGMVWAAVDTVFYLRRNHDLSECIEAAKSANGDLQRAMDYFKECTTCYTMFGMHKLLTLPSCQCLVCTECFAEYFTNLTRTTPCMYRFNCPVCSMPDLKNSDPETYQTYFAYLSTMLRNCLERRDFELYEAKLAMWNLIEDPKFRWCAHGCSAGFINERDNNKIQCPECKRHQCFACKKPWADQHENISCEEFDAWKKANDPEFQQQGLAAHLKENGINCPKCKMRYELAKGGCMHFKCPQCHHEFCCGCNLPFRNYPACNLLPTCNGKGLHAHHPRDCFYYLRDEECRDLQQLLQKHGINYNQPTNAAAAAAGDDERPQVCPVKEQHESPNGLVDDICGKPLKDQCGLCENHYKEYLVGLINQHNVDPVEIFGVDSLQAALRRNGKQIPNRNGNEADAAYCVRLIQEIQLQLPLRGRNAQGVQGEEAAANQI